MDEEKVNQSLKMANASKMVHQMRYSENLNDRKIKQRKESSKNAKLLVCLSIIAALDALMVIGYEQSKAKLKETKIDARTGYVMSQNSYNPSSNEIFNEMVNEISGKSK